MRACPDDVDAALEVRDDVPADAVEAGVDTGDVVVGVDGPDPPDEPEEPDEPGVLDPPLPEDGPPAVPVIPRAADSAASS